MKFILSRGWVLPAFCVICISCGSNELEELTEQDYVLNDSIIEYDIDEERVSAVDFNNDLSLMQEDMLYITEKLFLSDTSMVVVNHENAIFEAQINLAELDEMKFDGTEEPFVLEMKKLMTFYLDELNTGFMEIIPLLKKSTLSSDEEAQLDAYDLSFVSKEKEIFMQIFEVQNEFARVNNISLQDQ
jgi:hypothetical protein